MLSGPFGTVTPTHAARRARPLGFQCSSGHCLFCCVVGTRRRHRSAPLLRCTLLFIYTYACVVRHHRVGDSSVLLGWSLTLVFCVGVRLCDDEGEGGGVVILPSPPLPLVATMYIYMMDIKRARGSERECQEARGLYRFPESFFRLSWHWRLAKRLGESGCSRAPATAAGASSPLGLFPFSLLLFL